MITAIVLAGALGLPTSDNESAPSQRKKTPAAAVFNSEREALGLSFARTHHAELADLLVTLKTMNQSQYEKTVAELAHKSDQLSNLARRDPAIHRIALDDWKIQSRISVAAAQLRHKSDDSLRKELRELLARQIDLRIERRKLERDRAAAQLKKSEEAIVKLEAEREQAIEQQMKRLARTKGARPGSNKKKKSEGAPE